MGGERFVHVHVVDPVSVSVGVSLSVVPVVSQDLSHGVVSVLSMSLRTCDNPEFEGLFVTTGWCLSYWSLRNNMSLEPQQGRSTYHWTHLVSLNPFGHENTLWLTSDWSIGLWGLISSSFRQEVQLISKVVRF